MIKAVKKSENATNNKNKSYYTRIAICLVITIAFVCTLISQQVRLVSIRRETEECRKEIEAQKEEYSILKEKAKNNSSDDFYEKKARDEGYVREDETVFVIGN